MQKQSYMCVGGFNYVLNIIQIRNYVDGNREIKFTGKLKKSNSKEFSSTAWNWENFSLLHVSTDAVFQ